MTTLRPLAFALALLLPALATGQEETPSAPAPETPPAEAPLPKKTIVVPVPVPPAPTKPANATGTTPTDPAAVTPLDPPEAPRPVIIAPLPKEQPVEPPPPAPAPPPVPAPAPVVTPDPAPAPAAEPYAEPPPPSYAPETPQTKPEETKVSSGAILDGHLREGAFLSGPGSMTFVLHHTLMASMGGLATQFSWNGSNLELRQREALLAGALVGAGLGFGVSAWWQFNHWTDTPVASFGLIDSVVGGMFLAGLMNLISTDPTLITWAAVIGAEVGAWLTIVLGGGEMPMNEGVFIASGAGWALAYAALMLAIIRTSGTMTSSQAVVDTLMIAPGIGAGTLALMSMRYSPTTAQVLRADLFGAGVGLAVLLVSTLVLGDPTHNSTPYVLALLSSAGAIAAVSLLWEEAAERPNAIYVDPEKRRPYRTVWW